MEHIDRVYVLVHSKYEKERYDRLKQHLAKKRIPAEKIIFCAPTWGSELTSDMIFGVWDPFIRAGLGNFTWKSRCLSKGEISLVLNFYAAAKHAVDSNFSNILVFESDVYLRDDFLERIGQVWTDLSGAWDYVSLGEGIGTRPEQAPHSYLSPSKVYKPPHQFVFRCTDSMLFKVEFLKKVLGTLFPFRECLDWELNYQLAIHKGVAFWADPPLAEQGSSRCREPTLLPA